MAPAALAANQLCLLTARGNCWNMTVKSLCGEGMADWAEKHDECDGKSVRATPFLDLV